MEACSSLPKTNIDVSGVGVRISFYTQAVFLALLSTRSVTTYATGNALGTLIVTNLAYAVATIGLGFKRDPDLTLYDGVIVVYLLTLSWLAIMFSLPQYNRFRHSDPVIKILAILQSYVVLGCAFTILVAAPNFGAHPECNAQVFAFIFAPFSIQKARPFFLSVLVLVTAGYTILIVNDYRVAGSYSPKAPPEESRDEQVIPTLPHSPPSRHRFPTETFFSPKFDGRIFVTTTLILSFSSVVIVNTELLRRRNLERILHDGQIWTFGQILPLFLCIPSVVNTIKVFASHGCGSHPHRRNRGTSAVAVV